MMKETVKCLTLAMVFLGTVKISTQCVPPPPPSTPLTVENRVQRAPIVVRGYLVRKIKDGTTNGIYKACLYITHVYKGSVFSNYICAGDFGSDTLCLVSLDFGVEYLIFLDGTRGRYVARYDYIHSAAVHFNDDVLKEIKNGICCPNILGGRQCFYMPDYVSSVSFVTSLSQLNSTFNLLYAFNLFSKASNLAKLSAKETKFPFFPYSECKSGKILCHRSYGPCAPEYCYCAREGRSVGRGNGRR